MKTVKSSGKFISIFSSIIYLLLILNAGCSNDCGDSCSESDEEPQAQAGWTVMVYGDGDNNLESYLLEDVEEMKSGFVDGQGVNLIVLADRSASYSKSDDGFGENFTDTRLYKITNGKATRISGGTDFPEMTVCSSYEANMGDPAILKKFIKSCKTNYPADHYALILWNHGSGARKKSASASESEATDIASKAICEDDTDGDILYTAEITDNLTSAESVDLLGFDACLMGTAEVAYQYRPGNGGFCADYMVASPASEWGYGWDYERIFKRLQSGGGNTGVSNHITGETSESYYDPSTLTAKQLGEVIVEAQYDSTQIDYTDETDQTLSCYDLSAVSDVKDAVDTLAESITSNQSEVETIRSSSGSDTNKTPTTMYYFNASSSTDWLQYPYFDLYDLCERIENSTLGSTVTGNAATVISKMESMVIYSFGGSDYNSMGYSGSLQNGKNGLSIFFPAGDDYHYSALYIDWTYQWWYNALDLSDYQSYGYYGNLAWCIDGASSTTNNVGNWFELLDSWYDPSNGSDGGLNGYQY